MVFKLPAKPIFLYYLHVLGKATESRELKGSNVTVTSTNI